MPPRYAYWTILVDDQPTAFRAGSQEDLLPTFKRLKEKHPSAVMKWFQNGKLWDSRIDAQEAMRARGEMGRRGDERQAGFRSRDRDFKTSRPSTFAKATADKQGFKTSRPRAGERRDGGKRTAWTPRGEPSTPAPARNADDKLDWKPKGEFTPAPKRSERADWKPKTARAEKPEWKPKGKPFASAKPQWKPKGEFTPAPGRSEKPDWKPKSFKRPDFKRNGDDSRPAKPEWKPKGSFDRAAKRESKPKGFAAGGRESRRSSPASEGGRKPPGKLEWKPKSESPGSREKRKWVPKEEYKKSQGIEARRDKNWRPGGEHKDPRQKYKDAKKAKWTRFKQTIRKKWDGKKGKS